MSIASQGSFSLEHPTQYFIESRNVRSAEGGGDIGGSSSIIFFLYQQPIQYQ